MEFLFIRHGQAEHNLDTPDRLNRLHPKLTDRGKRQADELKKRIRIDGGDLLLVSPTVRTLETLERLTELSDSRPVWVSPLVGPRMFPQNPEWTTLPEAEFARLTQEMFDWITLQNARRTVIVSHDGTINAYRQLLGEKNLSRQDFLGEAGSYTLKV